MEPTTKSLLRQWVKPEPRMTCVALCALFLSMGAARGQNVISTVAGGPPPNSLQALAASLGQPGGVATDKFGNFYFVSQGLSSVFEVDATGTLSLVAGTDAFGFSGDGGPATAASLEFPDVVAVDSTGNLLIADTGNQPIGGVDDVTTWRYGACDQNWRAMTFPAS